MVRRVLPIVPTSFTLLGAAACLSLLAPAAALADEPPPAPAAATPPSPIPAGPPPMRAAPPGAPTDARGPAWPPSPAELPPPDPASNTLGMRVGGIVSTSLGGAQALVGFVLLIRGLGEGGLCAAWGQPCGGRTQIIAGAVTAATSAIPLGIGIALLVRARKIDRARMSRSWHGAPGGAGWEWQF